MISIIKYESGSLYEMLNLKRKGCLYEKAVLADSLFVYWLEKRGWNKSRNFISIDFNSNACVWKNDKRVIIKSKQEIRAEWYEKGLKIKYHTNDKTQTITYKRLVRGAGQAKAGSCIFCNSEIWKECSDFLSMGIETKKIVELEAYKSLICSGLKYGTEHFLKINPENIVVLKDVVKTCTTDVLSIELENERAVAVERNNYILHNKINDGMGLIREDLFPDFAEGYEGYILLRQHMFKSAVLKCDIRGWFRENGVEEIRDCFDKIHKVEDIEMIVTKESMKFLKFGVSIGYWNKKVRELDCFFGIVKSTYKSKHCGGDAQRMSYQMTSCLDTEDVFKVAEYSKKYIQKLKNDNEEFIKYLQNWASFTNDYEALLGILKKNPDFIKSRYFNNRRKRIVDEYLKKIRRGKLLIENAENCTMFGNPISLLRSAAGMEFENEFSEPFSCYCERFREGEKLALFRSPHNSRSNIGFVINEKIEDFKKYFELGKEIIILNAASDIMDRLNGADWDSDMAFVTNNPYIVGLAKRCRKEHKTVVNNIPSSKKNYEQGWESLNEIDNNITKYNMVTGLSSNLAALAQAEYFNGKKELKNKIDILAVIAQIAIDSAKRESQLDLLKELKEIKRELNIEKIPEFWRIIKPETTLQVDYSITCPMNELQKLKIERKKMIDLIENMEFIEPIKKTQRNNSRISKKVLNIIETYDILNLNRDMMESEFEKMIKEIQNVYFSKNSQDIMYHLICQILEGKVKNGPALMGALYYSSPQTFLSVFSQKTVQN